MQGQRAHEHQLASGARSLVARALSPFVDALLPPRCVACDLPSTAPLCRACDESVLLAPHGGDVVVPFLFGGALADALRRAKFRRDEGAARALAALFARSAVVTEGVDVVTFVPAHARRLRARGFDVAALLARALAAEAGVPLRPLLTCTRLDAPLSFGADVKERAARVAGRYRAAAGAAGQRVLLVDDVVTTGATLREAGRTLERAGAAAVVRCALAATPRHSP